MIYVVENQDGVVVGLQIQNLSHVVKSTEKITAISMLDGVVVVVKKPFLEVVQEINILEDSHPEIENSGLENSGPEKSV